MAKETTFKMLWKKGIDPSKSFDLESTSGEGPRQGYRLEKDQGMIIERDVAVTLRDGVKIYIDVFRPEKEGKYPPIVAWSPYGKHNRIDYLQWWPTCGVKKEWISKYAAFEAPDPVYWCPRGYGIINVDPRGAWYSEGDLTYWNGDGEAKDCYDLIEWAGTQTWSSGKVGMSGVSYLASIQWLVAPLNPPHLAAIIPWEGFSDMYRELCFHGGMPETWFVPFLWDQAANFTTTRMEDVVAMCKEHPLFDDYWATKVADFSKIKVPAYVVVSWTDHALHTRGTLEAFNRISSEQKWLEIHGRMKWENYYQPDRVEKQRQFFDYFLKGIETGVTKWSKVRLEVRERSYVGKWRGENEWPLARTQYTKLFLNASDGKLSKSPFEKEAQVRYNVNDMTDKTQNAKFEYKFDKRTELTGYMKLKLWVQADGSDDMDLFVAIEKINPSGEIVTFPCSAQMEDGPVALGWLRVSHCELDKERSTPYQPWHKHQRELKLSAGEIVPVEIEIWPSGTLFEAGTTLRLIVQGSDILEHDPEKVFWAGQQHKDTVNRGKHVIYTGGKYDSHLLVPVIP